MALVTSKSRWTAVATVIGAAVLLAVAFQYSKAEQAQRIVSDHALVANADQARVASVTVRADLGVALSYMALVDSGLNPPENVDAAITETRAAAENLSVTVQALSAATQSAQLASSMSELQASLDQTLEQMTAGNQQNAHRLAVDEVIPTLAALNQQIATLRDTAQVRIEAEGGQADVIARVTGFAVGLVAPALTAIALRRASRLRQKRLLLEAELRREQDLIKTKDEFIGNLSHELRTPLTGIVGFAGALSEILHADQEEGERAFLRETADLLVGESNTLARMVDDLLTAMKADENALYFQPEAVDIETEVATVLAPFHRAGVGATIDLTPSAVWVDRHRLRQVLRNLISNGTTHGGPAIRIIGRLEGERYLLTVADNGDGVPQHISEHLFERFVHRGTEPLLTGSVGLGLAIVAMLVGRMGGSISYKREAGWTRFEMSLPITDEQPTLVIEPVQTKRLRRPTAKPPKPEPVFANPVKLGERPSRHPS